MKKLCFLALLAATGVVAAGHRQVVLITLDGYPAYELRDPYTAAATLRSMIPEGAWAPEGMTPVNPTVTWPNHTSMVTGVEPAKHGVIYNGLPVRRDGRVRVDATASKAELVLVPTLYDLAHERGLKTAEVDWPATDRAGTFDFEFAEIPEGNSPLVKEMVASGQISAEDVANFRKKPITWRDEIWTEAGIRILKEHHPSLLLFHLLTTDSLQHQYGPASLPAQAARALADRQVARLVEAVRESGDAATTTFIVIADHGFATAARQIRPGVLLKERRLKAAVVAEGGTAMIYGDVPADIFQGVEGIGQVITPDQYAQWGYPAPGERMGNLVLAAKDGYAFSGAEDGAVVQDLPAKANPGNHGYLSTNPQMRPIFVAWGAGIRKGVEVHDVHTIDIAPTIARLLGVELKGAEGKAIAGALR